MNRVDAGWQVREVATRAAEGTGVQCREAGKEGLAGQAKFISLERERGAAPLPREDAARVRKCRDRA